MSRLAIAAVTSHLGNHAAEVLLDRGVAPSRIVGITRDAERAQELADRGVEIREADYNDRASYAAALAGVDRLLLVSSGDMTGDRAAQHRNVIEAAREAGVQLVAYTSILNAASTTIQLGAAHQATEQILAEVGVPHVLLRNGWYTENYLGALDATVAHGLYGSAGDGQVQTAARADYAEAAAVVLASDEPQAGKIYELAGDTPHTLADLAGLIGAAVGAEVAYVDVPEAAYAEILTGAGLPEAFAGVLADSSTAVARGELVTSATDLTDLLGRPTTPPAATIAAAVQELQRA